MEPAMRDSSAENPGRDASFAKDMSQRVVSPRASPCAPSGAGSQNMVVPRNGSGLRQSARSSATYGSEKPNRKRRSSRPHSSWRGSTQDLGGVTITTSVNSRSNAGSDKDAPHKRGPLLRLSVLSALSSNHDSRQFNDSPWEDRSADTRGALSVYACSSKPIGDMTRLDTARRYARRIVRGTCFDAAIGLIIILNMICIAIEQECMLANDEAPWLYASEYVFLTVYALELALRFFAEGCAALRDRWVQFDLVIVAVSAFTQWFLVHTDFEEMRLVVVMRLARLARLARAARLIIHFRELWILVNGLIASVGTMYYTCALIFVMLFSFALLGVELIAVRHGAEDTSDPAVDRIVSEYFGGLWITMLTLTQFVTLDSIASIYRPLVRHDPFLIAYFTVVFLAIAILLMNLITAVCVNEALEQAQKNKQAAKVHELRQKKKALSELRHYFSKLDCDQSGSIELGEILGSTDEAMDYVQSFVKETDIHEVFDILDLDGNGALDADEFCEGLWQTMKTPTPLDFKRIDKRVEFIREEVQEMRAMQRELLSKFNEVNQQVNNLTNRLSKSCPAADTDVVQPSSPLSRVSVQSSFASTEAPAFADDVLRELRNITKELNHQLASAFGQDVWRTSRGDMPSNQGAGACTKEVRTSTECVKGWRACVCESSSTHGKAACTKEVWTSAECTDDWRAPVERELVRAAVPKRSASCFNIKPHLAPTRRPICHMNSAADSAVQPDVAPVHS